jgi:uncharacterized membrane protein
MRIHSPARVFFAVTLMAVGLYGLMAGVFPPLWSGVPNGSAVRELLVYACAIVTLGAGLGLAIRRTSLVGAALLMSYLALWIIAFRIPLIIQSPASPGIWWALGSTTAMLGATWAVFANAAGDYGPPFARGRSGQRIAAAMFGLGLIPFGIAHFTFWERTVSMVPAWLPWHVGWAALTGAAFIAAGLALTVGVHARLAATLTAFQIAMFTLLVWVPVIVTAPTPSDWTEFIESWTLTAAAWIVADSFRPTRDDGVAH